MRSRTESVGRPPRLGWLWLPLSLLAVAAAFAHGRRLAAATKYPVE